MEGGMKKDSRYPHPSSQDCFISCVIEMNRHMFLYDCRKIISVWMTSSCVLVSSMAAFFCYDLLYNPPCFGHHYLSGGAFQ